MALLTLSWWPLLSPPWLSPAAAWFIFFNAVVGAIAVMSATSGGAVGGATSSPRRRLCRSGSSSSMVLDRLRSFFVFPVGQLPIDETSAASGSPHCYHCCSQEAEATQVCAPSERNSQALPAATTGGTATQPSAPVATATAEDHAPPAPPPSEEEAAAEAEEEQGHDESTISLDEAYALAQRQRHHAKPLALPPPAAAASATVPTERKKKPANAVADWRRASKAGEAQALEGKAELNARAELFIRQFREELRLQRLNSVLKHTHALGSPTAAPAAR